jgi:hypothetical protein
MMQVYYCDGTWGFTHLPIMVRNVWVPHNQGLGAVGVAVNRRKSEETQQTWQKFTVLVHKWEDVAL